MVNDILAQLDDIKNLYDLHEEDVQNIYDINKNLVVINDDYNKLLAKVGGSNAPYSMVHKEIEELTNRLKITEDNLDEALKTLGNMYDDEERAREQLYEIQEFLKQCKLKMRSYKLPIITDNYFVQLSEANEAIGEVVKELEKKPIVITVLNTRVDTARDLVLKLYNTTNEMIRMAQYTEIAIVYGNRYRNTPEVSAGLDDARVKFFMGDYKKSLDIAIKSISIVEDDVYNKLFSVDNY